MTSTVKGALAFLGTLFSLLLVTLPSYAAITEEGAPNIMVRPFDGPKGAALNERVVKVLEQQGADLVPAGFEGPRALESDEDYAAVAAQLNVRAYILGVAVNDNTGWKLTLTVRQGSDGKVVGTQEFAASWFPGLLTKIDEELIPGLEKLLTGAQVPEEAPADEPTEAEAPPEPEKPRPVPFDVTGGVGFVFRSFAGSNAADDQAGDLQTRDQSGGMATLRLGASLYPAALFTKGFVANLGLIAHFERSLGGKAQRPEGVDFEGLPTELTTTLTAWDLGARVRLPISMHELGFSVTYGSQLFEIDGGPGGPGPIGDDNPTPKPVPDVDYSFVRLGADFTYNMSKYFFSGNVGFRLVSSAGEDPGQIQNTQWFPESDVGGFDFGLTGGYLITDRITATIGLDLRNFFYSMNNVGDDFGVRPVAGGATDMYFAGLISAQYRMK
jgi:hypothetical protein